MKEIEAIRNHPFREITGSYLIITGEGAIPNLPITDAVNWSEGCSSILLLISFFRGSLCLSGNWFMIIKVNKCISYLDFFSVVLRVSVLNRLDLTELNWFPGINNHGGHEEPRSSFYYS